MGGMTDREARQWCEANGVTLRDGKPDTSALGSGVSFAIPEDCAGRVLLSRFLYPSTFQLPGSVIIWT